MKIVTKGRLNLLLEFILYSVLYTGVFLLVEGMFKSFEINSDHRITVAFIAIVIIYVLEKVLKPILVTISTPITGLTFGLFYFVINTFMLKLTDWIMGPKLDFTDIWVLFFISIVLALLNMAIEKIIIEPIIRKAAIREPVSLKPTPAEKEISEITIEEVTVKKVNNKKNNLKKRKANK